MIWKKKLTKFNISFNKVFTSITRISNIYRIKILPQIYITGIYNVIIAIVAPTQWIDRKYLFSGPCTFSVAAMLQWYIIIQNPLDALQFDFYPKFWQRLAVNLFRTLVFLTLKLLSKFGFLFFKFLQYMYVRIQHYHMIYIYIYLYTTSTSTLLFNEFAIYNRINILR